MKAIVRDRYGPPGLLHLRDLEEPRAGDGDVVVRVHAASLNPADWHIMRGEPYLLRAMGFGIFRPKKSGLGLDVAGVVQAVGRKVSHLKAGDEVFGSSLGALAELVSGDAKGFNRKPANLTFEQAAAVPIAACTALQGLRDQGGIRSGQKVLIVGASGGVGTFAVQIARAFGANVTGVCSTRNLDLVRSLGAERAIDYTREDYIENERGYDIFLDTVGTRSLSDCRRVMAPRGRYVMVGGPTGRWFKGIDRMIRAMLWSPFLSQRLLPFVAAMNEASLTALRDLMEAGKVTPVIDRQYSLSEVPDAIRYLEEGHARGKVVITVR